MEIHQDTMPQDIVDCVRVQYAERIDYQVALRVRNASAGDSLEAYRISFQQLPLFLNALQAGNPDTYIHLLIQQDRFQRVFICHPIVFSPAPIQEDAPAHIQEDEIQAPLTRIPRGRPR